MLSQKKLADKRRRKRQKRKKVVNKKTTSKNVVLEAIKKSGLLSGDSESDQKLVEHVMKMKNR